MSRPLFWRHTVALLMECGGIVSLAVVVEVLFFDPRNASPGSSLVLWSTVAAMLLLRDVLFFSAGARIMGIAYSPKPHLWQILCKNCLLSFAILVAFGTDYMYQFVTGDVAKYVGSAQWIPRTKMLLPFLLAYSDVRFGIGLRLAALEVIRKDK